MQEVTTVWKGDMKGVISRTRDEQPWTQSKNDLRGKKETFCLSRGKKNQRKKDKCDRTKSRDRRKGKLRAVG